MGGAGGRLRGVGIEGDDLHAEGNADARHALADRPQADEGETPDGRQAQPPAQRAEHGQRRAELEELGAQVCATVLGHCPALLGGDLFDDGVQLFEEGRLQLGLQLDHLLLRVLRRALEVDALPFDLALQLEPRRLVHDGRGLLEPLLGGRIAEEITIGSITTGAGNDLERATELARQMVCEWGMSSTMGPLTVSRKLEMYAASDDTPRSGFAGAATG